MKHLAVDTTQCCSSAGRHSPGQQSLLHLRRDARLCSRLAGTEPVLQPYPTSFMAGSIVGKANCSFSLRGISNDPTRQHRACREDLGPPAHGSYLHSREAPGRWGAALLLPRDLVLPSQGSWTLHPAATGPAPAESKQAVRRGSQGSAGSAAGRDPGSERQLSSRLRAVEHIQPVIITPQADAKLRCGTYPSLAWGPPGLIQDAARQETVGRSSPTTSSSICCLFSSVTLLPEQQQRVAREAINLCTAGAVGPT